MPTYEYRCEAGHEFEKVQKITEVPLSRCEVCDAPAERLISRASFILKGGGWYAQDYTKKPGASSDGDAKADAPKADASKTDAPKADVPKTEAPKAEAPKTEAPKAPTSSGS